MNKMTSLALVALLATTSAAWAAPYGQGGCPNQGERAARHEQLAEQLQLTDEQRVAFDAMSQNRMDKSQRQQQHQAHRQAIDTLMAQPTFDEQQAKTLLQQQSQQMQEQRLQHLKARHAFMQSLTPEQRELFQQFHQQRGPGRTKVQAAQ